MPEQTPVPPFRHRLPREVADRIRSTAPPPPGAPRARRALPRLAVAAAVSAAALAAGTGTTPPEPTETSAVVDAWPVKWTGAGLTYP